MGEDNYIQFLLTDFSDLSQKLESTDQKMQFCTQLYITLVTAIIVALIAFLKPEGTELFEDRNVFLFLAFIFVLFLVIGELVICYMLAGYKCHFKYLCRLNKLRKLILEANEKSEEFIKDYGYTNENMSLPGNGMTHYMIYLILFVITGFCFVISLSVACYFLNDKYLGKSIMVSLVCAFFFFGFNKENIDSQYAGMKE